MKATIVLPGLSLKPWEKPWYGVCLGCFPWADTADANPSALLTERGYRFLFILKFKGEAITLCEALLPSMIGMRAEINVKATA
jgi:hypothetical protein